MSSYVHLLILGMFSMLFSGAFLLLSRLLGPKHPTEVKQSTFECGVPVEGSFLGKFPVKFYLVVVLFLLFDLEVVFLYPWAVQQNSLPWMFWFFEGLFYASTLLVGWLYIVQKGVLNWGTPQKTRSFEAVILESD